MRSTRVDIRNGSARGIENHVKNLHYGSKLILDSFYNLYIGALTEIKDLLTDHEMKAIIIIFDDSEYFENRMFHITGGYILPLVNEHPPIFYIEDEPFDYSVFRGKIKTLTSFQKFAIEIWAMNQVKGIRKDN